MYTIQMSSRNVYKSNIAPDEPNAIMEKWKAILIYERIAGPPARPGGIDAEGLQF